MVKSSAKCINTTVGKLEGLQHEGLVVDVNSIEKVQEENTLPSKRTGAHLKKKANNQDIQDLKKIALNMRQLKVEAA